MGTGRQMAEEWLLQHAAISLGEDKILSDQEVSLQKKPKDLAPDGDKIDEKMRALLKGKRILDEMITKMGFASNDQMLREIHTLWKKLGRIICSSWKCGRWKDAISDISAITLPFIRKIRDDIVKDVNQRGQELRRIRMRLFDTQKAVAYEKDPMKAFECLKPDREPPLTALLREDGTVTGNRKEMDGILRGKWGEVFCKHDKGRAFPKVETFIEKFGRFIPSSPMKANDLTADMIIFQSDVRATGMDGWSPRDVKRLPKSVFFIIWCTSIGLLKDVENGRACLPTQPCRLFPKEKDWTR